MKKIKASLKKVKTPKKSTDVPVSKRLLDLVSQELKSEMALHALENKKRFKALEGSVNIIRIELKAHETKMDGRLEAYQTKIDDKLAAYQAGFDDKLAAYQARFDDKLETHQAGIDNKLARMLVLLEEQNDRNKIVLDGYTLIYDKLQSIEKRLTRVEVKVFGTPQD